ncbi:hypothetical protein P171DRAFT_449068 [Karstenula rhodostoma CBS 690.94]|uniref:Uncharacterized protein n=1 Tax=Karstenula rhodostoma CBS 690.94 TaxID=1392251 RepID=A0A9P4P702_9PLEO|nr:hypothetical protein P171DRAFT_449068 [Karstenula rhodostoma CBS 690.94]
MSSSTTKPSREQIKEACIALSRAIADKKYAVVGGGSPRTTEDVDFVVPKNAVAAARTLILKPALILNAKCRSILGRSNGEKKKTDAADITFLLWWLATNNAFPSAQEVPNANKEFVTWFVETYRGAEYWTGARLNLERGSF